MLKKITSIVLLIAIVVVGGMGMSRMKMQVAEAAFYAVQTPATTLYAGISSSATSARLRSFNDIYGNKLTMAMFGSIGYVTFEPGISGKEEVASFTGITDNGDGTQTLTGLTRGLLSRHPFGTGGTARSHGSNTYVVVSNAGEFYNKFAILDNNAAVAGLWTFNSYLPTTSITATSSNQFVTKGYADGLSFAGVATSTESSFGGVWLATKLQQASSTDGAPNAPYVLQSKNATSTYNAGAGGGNGLNVLVTQNDNKIDSNFIRQSDTFAWTAANTHSGVNTFSGGILATASSTFSGAFTTHATTTIPASSLTNGALVLNGLAYKFPSSRAASSTVPMQDASGNITFNDPIASFSSGSQSIDPSSACTGTLNVAHGLGRAPKIVEVDAVYAPDTTNGIWSTSHGSWDATNSASVTFQDKGTASAANSSSNAWEAYDDVGTTGNCTATITVDATNIKFALTLSGTMTAGTGIKLHWKAQ